MDFTELKTALKRYGFDDSDPLDSWLNAGYLDWVCQAYDWPFLQMPPIVIATGIGVSNVVLPSDVGHIMTVKNLDNGQKLSAMERTEFERVVNDPTEGGLPIYYVMTGLDVVTVWRVPNIPVNLRVVYARKLPELVNAGDVPLIPASLHYAIVQAGAAIALQSENEEERSENAEKQFTNTVNRTWSRMSGSQHRDEPPTVTDVMGYGN